MTLNNATPQTQACITEISGDVRLLTRLASIGLIPGGTITIVRNDKRRPILVYGRDTLLAISRKDCASIKIEEVA